MIGYCNKCGGRFEGQMLCPSCGCKLAHEADALKVKRLPNDDGSETLDLLTLPRRFGIGLLLVCVFFNAFVHFAASIAVAPDDIHRSDVTVGIMTLAVILAATTTGLANHWAELNGFLLGSVTALAYLGVQYASKVPFPSAWLIGLPVMQGLVGTMAGFAGRLLFMPAPRFRVPVSADRTPLPVSMGKRKKSAPLRPLNILLGVLVATVAFIYADPIRFTLGSMLGHGGGSYGSGRFVTWEITMIGALIAGVLAGAGGKYGVRQGLLAGLFTSVGLITAAMKSGMAKIPASDFWVDQLGLESANATVYGILAVTLLVTMTLGGWMGSQLFPKRRK